MSSTAAAAGVALKEEQRTSAESDLLLVEVTEWEAPEAILRSVTEVQPTGSLRMSIPYRPGCAYSFANGRYIMCLQFIKVCYFLIFKQ